MKKSVIVLSLVDVRSSFNVTGYDVDLRAIKAQVLEEMAKDQPVICLPAGVSMWHFKVEVDSSEPMPLGSVLPLQWGCVDVAKQAE